MLTIDSQPRNDSVGTAKYLCRCDERMLNLSANNGVFRHDGRCGGRDEPAAKAGRRFNLCATV